MLEKILLADKPCHTLILEFVIQTKSEDADNLLCEFIQNEMRARLAVQRAKGFKGWHTAQCENEDLIARLKKNLEKGDLIDVINLASMLLARQSMFKEVYIP